MHTKVWNFIKRNREVILLSILVSILFEIVMHEYQVGAWLGVIGIVINSHVFCCLLPLGITALFHKKECDCHFH